LTGRRERGLGFVQNIEPCSSEPVLHEREERLPVRHLVERPTAVGINYAQGVDLAGDVVEALGS
jgi:hypothetical protein